MSTRIQNFCGRVLLCTLLFGTSARASEEELIISGNFDSLDSWGETMPGIDRELIEENSPFSQKHPDNKRSVLLSGRGRNPHLLQALNTPISSGKASFSMDFKIKEPVNQDGVSGWGVGLFDGVNPAKSTAGFSASSRFRLQNDSGAGGKILFRSKFTPETWYHFSATLDLETGKWSGMLIDEHGNQEEFFDEPFHDLSSGSIVIGGIRIAPQGGRTSETAPVPLLVDNLSLQVGGN